MNSLKADSINLSYGKKKIIKNLDIDIPKGKITILIGANGSGKSTLLRALSRLMKPDNGQIVLNGKDIFKLSTKEVAKNLSILPQSPNAPEGMTVFQLIKQGRYPYQSLLQQWSKEDERLVNRALKETGMYDLKNRTVDSLSGGQRQRAWIAMTLAQNTEIILLDEPTTYLDLAHQIEILDLLDKLNKNEDRTIVMVLHDLNLAFRYADYIVAIKEKNIYVEGKPYEVVTPQMIRNVFDMKCRIINDPVSDTPLCIPVSNNKVVNL